jgi:hypothetical protein
MTRGRGSRREQKVRRKVAEKTREEHRAHAVRRTESVDGHFDPLAPPLQALTPTNSPSGDRSRAAGVSVVRFLFAPTNVAPRSVQQLTAQV